MFLAPAALSYRFLHGEHPVIGLVWMLSQGTSMGYVQHLRHRQAAQSGAGNAYLMIIPGDDLDTGDCRPSTPARIGPDFDNPGTSRIIKLDTSVRSP